MSVQLVLPQLANVLL